MQHNIAIFFAPNALLECVWQQNICNSVSQFLIVVRVRDNAVISHFIFLIYLPEHHFDKNKNRIPFWADS